MALAWKAVQAEICTGCGQPRHESYARENDGAYEAHAVRCHACAARETHTDVLQENNTDLAGIHVYVTKERRDG